MTHDGPQITGGVDTHGLTHHAAVIDTVGRHLADREFPATIRGYRDLLDWMRSHGELVAVGVEGTGAYGAELARVLTAAGVTVTPAWLHPRSSRAAQCRCRPPSLGRLSTRLHHLRQCRDATPVASSGEGNDVDHSRSAVSSPAARDQRMHGGCMRLSRCRRVGLGLGGRNAQTIRKDLAKPYHHADLLRDHERPSPGRSERRGDATAGRGGLRPRHARCAPSEGQRAHPRAPSVAHRPPAG
ncbi:transposase [Streptomyces sp. NPDC048419]|uniref:IS110 family transposase n=1 Tax=Streptomyces sp. NPDC048419 TaxID=3365547 RepID=UPI003722D737